VETPVEEKVKKERSEAQKAVLEKARARTWSSIREE
jgi:hypothetical protein